MTEELEKEAEEYIKWHPTEGIKDFVIYKVRVGENAFAYVVEHKNELYCSDWIKICEGTEQECYRVVGYLDSAEPREKHIAELKKQLDLKEKALSKAKKETKRIADRVNKDKRRLIRRKAELEELVEKYRQAVDKCLHITFMGGGCEVNTIGQYATLVDGYLTNVEGLAKWKK